MAISSSSSARAVIERLVIDHVGHRGDGVALAGGETVYVPYTLGGETVEVGPVPGHHPDRRRLLQVERASPQRITPFCRHFGICGGCAIQHWEAERYRAWKRELVVETLAQARLACEVDALIDAHGLGRRRITLHARIGTHDVLKVGFAATNSHDIIPIDRCPILDPGLSGAIEAAWALAEPLISVGKPLDIQVTATDNGLDVDVRGSGPLPAQMIATLSRLAEQHRLARLTRHGELVLMRTPPTVAIGAAQLTLPPGSFLQATVAGEEALAALVSGHCKRAKHIADLFCGVGPFALRLAAKSRISAFDSDAGAIAALQHAAASTTIRSYSTRRGRARRRKCFSSRPARYPWWLRYPATLRRLRATRGFWSMAATGWRA
jgi:23S rRNA (uracil1939-C5)-methyltransferase